MGLKAGPTLFSGMMMTQSTPTTDSSSSGCINNTTTDNYTTNFPNTTAVAAADTTLSYDDDDYDTTTTVDLYAIDYSYLNPPSNYSTSADDSFIASHLHAQQQQQQQQQQQLLLLQENTAMTQQYYSRRNHENCNGDGCSSCSNACADDIPTSEFCRLSLNENNTNDNRDMNNVFGSNSRCVYEDERLVSNSNNIIETDCCSYSTEISSNISDATCGESSEFQYCSNNSSHHHSKNCKQQQNQQQQHEQQLQLQKQQEKARNLLLFLPDKEDGDTSLHISVAQGNDHATLHIIQRAPDFTYLNMQNHLLQTPLHIAALTNSSSIARKLICAGADVFCQDRNGNTPLHVACIQGQSEELIKQLTTPIRYQETLLNAYPIPFAGMPQDMSIKNYDGFTCLHLAVLNKHSNIVKLLLQVGADPNCSENKSGKTALHLAAELNCFDIVSLLLENRLTEVDVVNYSGYSPAMLAYSRGFLDVVRLLVRNGASYGFYFDTD